MLNNPSEISQIDHESIAEITFALIIDRKDRATDQKAAVSLLSTQYVRPHVTNNSLCLENGMLHAAQYHRRVLMKRKGN